MASVQPDLRGVSSVLAYWFPVLFKKLKPSLFPFPFLPSFLFPFVPFLAQIVIIVVRVSGSVLSIREAAAGKNKLSGVHSQVAGGASCFEEKKDRSFTAPQTKGWPLAVGWNSGFVMYGLGDLLINLSKLQFSLQ